MGNDESENISSPHDALVKRAFGSVENAEGELRAVLPQGLVEAIDWTTLVLEPQSFVNEKLRVRHVDLLYRVTMRGHPAYLYTVFEAQRTVDKTMPLRLLVYMARIWDDWLRKRGTEDGDLWPPPSIVPIVLYHGKGRWSRSTQFSELFEFDHATKAAMAEHVPHFRFILDDLAATPDEVLLARTLSSVAQLVLGVLKHGMDEGLGAAFFATWAKPFAALLRQNGGSDELDTIMWYIMKVNPTIEHDELGSLMLEQFGSKAEKAVTTAGERLWQEGRQEGRQEGHQEGQTTLLLKQLTHRFGSLSTDTISRVEGGTPQAIDQWAERVLKATSLIDVFAD